MASTDLFSRTVQHYLSPIGTFLNDPGVSEVMINGHDEIYIERDGELIRTEARFQDHQAYEAAINNVLQFTRQSLDDDRALIDSRLPDGSRVHVAKEPCARTGMAVTIRKFNRDMLDVDWLVELGTLTQQAAMFLKLAVLSEQNILVAGGTSSGKTSLLNALSRFIPAGQRIVVIEDSAELQLQQEHVISLEARPPDRYGRGAVSIRDLFRSSLRLRPDRIVIGEVRGGEALDMIQAMTSGHGGSMGTLHANNPADALNRLETMALMSKVDLPLHALRAQIASAIDLVVQMSRHIGGRRVVTQITQVDPLTDQGRYRLRDIYRLTQVPASSEDRASEKPMQLKWTGQRCAFGAMIPTAHRPPAEDELSGVLMQPDEVDASQQTPSGTDAADDRSVTTNPGHRQGAGPGAPQSRRDDPTDDQGEVHGAAEGPPDSAVRLVEPSGPNREPEA